MNILILHYTTEFSESNFDCVLAWQGLYLSALHSLR